MSRAVARAYDALADRYAAFVTGDLDRVPGDRAWLHAFAQLVNPAAGPVADFGCGPGHIVDALQAVGVPAVGWDMSTGLLTAAAATYPELTFAIGDLTNPPLAPRSLGGVVSRYSLIHVDPSALGEVFARWEPLMAPGAPGLLSFFAADSPAEHGRPFDHAVTTAFQICPQVVERQLAGVGLRVERRGIRPPIEGERLLDHGTILFQKASQRNIPRP